MQGGCRSGSKESSLQMIKGQVYDKFLNTEGICSLWGPVVWSLILLREPERRESAEVVSFVTTACPLLSSDDCSNPPGWVNVHHACEGDHVTTAVPLPTSAALPTGRA